MSAFEDDYLEHADMMPFAVAGELKMWNLRLPGIDLERMAEDKWLMMAWPPAYKFAVHFLEQTEMSEEAIRRALALKPDADIHQVPEPLPLEIRHRLYDIHRIRIAIIILYPDQPEHQRHWFSAKNGSLGGKTAIEAMTSDGTERVRKILEGRLSG
jgi:hypothetical protein